MNFEFTIHVQAERVSGKFATRDEVREQIEEWLEEANLGTVDSVGADGDSEYEIADWIVVGS